MRVLRISHSAVVSAWRERERTLLARGVEVELRSSARWNEGGEEVDFRPGADTFASGLRTWGRHPNLFLYDPVAIWRALRDGRWDVIDIHEEPCSLAAAEILLLRALLRVPAPFVLYSAQNIDKRYPPPFRWFERQALKRAGGVSVCNHEAGRILRRKGLRGTVAEIPLGVDLGIFTAAPAAALHEPPRVGYVGRLADYKGVHVLLDAVAHLPGAVVVMAGAGPAEAALRAQAARLGLTDRLELPGHTDTADLAALYRSFDVLVVPSLPTPTWLEQFGRVVVEAMASGVPVIASRSGALPDVVGDAGILVEPNDAEALTAAIGDLLKDEGRRRDLRARGLERCRRYTWDAVADGMQQLYGAVTSAASVPPVAAPSAGLDVIVVAYGSPDLLADALGPLVGSFPITVVDNSSSTATRTLVDGFGLAYLDPGRNLGFGAGVNYALERRADPDHDVLLLNPDAVVTAGDLTRLRQALADDPGLAAVGPVQRDGDGQPSRVRWPFPSPARAWQDAIGLAKLPHRGGFVIGSVLLIRAEALAAVGGFDERFFLYAEETDWQLRAVRSGWRVGVVDNATAMHIGAGTGGDSTRREHHFHKSHELFVRKHYGARGWAIFRAGSIAGAAIRSVTPGSDRRRRARRVLALYWRGPERAAADD